MLLRFAVENFLSFKELTEFYMIANDKESHHTHLCQILDRRILKGAFLFGANASGKTNFIKAIAFAHNIIIKGIEYTNFEKKYFRIDSNYKNKPLVLQFDFFSNNRFYSYGFAISYTDLSIEEEWLYDITESEKCIFHRSISDSQEKYTNHTELTFNDEQQKKRFMIYLEDISNIKMKKTLFLKDIVTRVPDNDQNYLDFKNVYNWFMSFVIIFQNSKYSKMMEVVENDDTKNLLEHLLEFFDTGIQSITHREVEFDKHFSYLPEFVLNDIKIDINSNLKKINSNIQFHNGSSLVNITQKDNMLFAKEIVSNHGNQDELFEYEDESEGTQKLFDLIPLFINIKNNHIIFIDELDRSLHTKAVQKFIDLFYSYSENYYSQLIATTHDSNMLDLDFIREDEIWFIERLQNHASKLYSLNKFTTGKQNNIEKDYLIGRYGAIPIFKNFNLD